MLEIGDFKNKKQKTSLNFTDFDLERKVSFKNAKVDNSIDSEYSESSSTFNFDFGLFDELVQKSTQLKYNKQYMYTKISEEDSDDDQVSPAVENFTAICFENCFDKENEFDFFVGIQK